MLKQFLENTEFPGRLLFAKVWGSRSHNCELPDSDWDFSGVYVCSTRMVLGINGYRESVVHDKGDNPGNDLDYQFREVHKFCQLLLKGNPGILEMLWTELAESHLDVFSTSEWIDLVKHRVDFLSRRAVAQYLGYIGGQITRLKKGSYLHTKGGRQNEKWIFHVYRLLGDVERIINGCGPQVWKEGVERDFLMSIRRGEFSDLTPAEEKLKQLQTKDLSHLPEEGDKIFLNDWLLKIRLTGISKGF